MRQRKLNVERPIIVESYNNGMTLRELADFHKVSPTTIRRLLVEEGVSIRRRGPQGPQKNSATPVVQDHSSETSETSNTAEVVDYGVQQSTL